MLSESEFDNEWIQYLKPALSKEEWKQKWDSQFQIPKKTINDVAKEVIETNSELLSRLNDYDSDGIPYWEKENKNADK